MTIYRIVCAAFLLHILALLRMSVTCIAIVRQECRTSYKFLSNAQIHTVRSINICFSNMFSSGFGAKGNAPPAHILPLTE